jgi:hypothetical protein
MQVGNSSHTRDRVNKTIPRSGKFGGFAFLRKNPSMCLYRITAAVPWVAHGNFNFSIFQPPRIGQPFVKEWSRRLRECIVTMQPRRVLLGRRWQSFALEKW